MSDDQYFNCLEQAHSLCIRYNWESVASYLWREGKFPEGFGKEVGQNVALFMLPCFYLPYYKQVEDRYHAGMLGKLRLLVAKINNFNRVKK